MIESLTPDQERMLPDIAAEWTAVGLSTELADRPRAEAAILTMYAHASLRPPRIVWCGSPLSQGLTRAIVWASVRASVRASVGASVLASVGASVGDSVRASVWASVRASVRDSVRDSVWASVRASVRDSVGDSVGDSVRASVWASVGASVRDSVRDSVWASVVASVGDSVYGAHDAGWIAFYDTFRRLGLRDETASLWGLGELARSAGWALPHRAVCWVSERHSTLRRDERGLLHRQDGPAVAYPDGWQIHAWHGTRVPLEWIEDRDTVDVSLCLTHPNVEQRRALCEILGWERVLAQLAPRTIHADADPQIGTLLEVDLPDAGRSRFVRVRCGTGRDFVLPVPVEMQTARQAVAWTYGMDEDDYRPEYRA